MKYMYSNDYIIFEIIFGFTLYIDVNLNTHEQTMRKLYVPYILWTPLLIWMITSVSFVSTSDSDFDKLL